jgi:hypothetical protein
VTTTKRVVIVTDPALAAAASELHHLRKLKRKAEERIAVVGDEVKVAVTKYRSEHGDVKVQVEDMELNLTATRRSTLKAEKLLERGVAPEIIQFATDSSEGESVRIRRVDDD